MFACLLSFNSFCLSVRQHKVCFLSPVCSLIFRDAKHSIQTLDIAKQSLCLEDRKSDCILVRLVIARNFSPLKKWHIKKPIMFISDALLHHRINSATHLDWERPQAATDDQLYSSAFLKGSSTVAGFLTCYVVTDG